MEKECKGCGVTFTPTHLSQKYCEICRQHYKPEKLAANLNKAFARNMTTYYDVDIEMRHATCKMCGKDFLFKAHRGKPQTPPDFCSNKCNLKNKIAKTKCAYCGKPMLETEDIRDTKDKTWFCCEKCENAYKLEKAREKGLTSICPTCGKEFLAEKTFCSRECYIKYVKKK